LTPLEDLHLAQIAKKYRDVDVNEDGPSSVEEVEMGLLAGDERASSLDGHGLSDADGDSEESGGSEFEVPSGDAEKKVPLTREDKKAMALLIVLCTYAPPGVSWCSGSFADLGHAVFNSTSLPLPVLRHNPRCSCESHPVVRAGDMPLHPRRSPPR